MKKLLTVLMFSALSVGCAAKQSCPQIPENACEQCWAKSKARASEGFNTASYVAVEGVSTTLEYLQKGEKYFSEKIEEWKDNHPEWVAEAQNKLKNIRAKIQELKQRSF